MGYTDAQGRPEWTAQPFVKKGTAHSRVVGKDSKQDEPDIASIDPAAATSQA